MLKNYLLLGCVLLGAGPVWATPQSTRDNLKQVEQQILQEQMSQAASQRKAAALSKEVKAVQGDLVTTAKKIQSQENRLSDLEDQKEALKKQEKEALEQLSLTDKQLYRVMKGMQTLALRPTELLLIQPKTPTQVFRSRLMMRYSLPVIGRIHDETRQKLENLARVRTELEQKGVQIRQVYSDLNDQNEKMNRLLLQKKIMQAQYTSDYEKSKKKVQALAAKAQDLKDLLKKLEEEQKRRKKTGAPVIKGTGAFRQAYGRLAWPVQGQLIRSFGSASASGAHTKGVVLKSRPKARLITPFDGMVLFAGPFQNYGQLLIVDHGNEYMTVMAGMEKIDVAVGQELLAGEPIASMGQTYTDLYLELRYQGQAIDPEPWFSQRGR